MNKQFILFAGGQYYPRPGWRDFQGNFESVAEAKAYVTERENTAEYFDWWQVVDIRAGMIVDGGGHAYSGDPFPERTT